MMGLISALSGGGDYTLFYGFHDVNGKLSWRPDARNRWSVSFYQGDDYLNYRYRHSNGKDREKARLSNVWGNWLLSTQWSRVHGSHLYSTQNLSMVKYRLKNAQSYVRKDSKEEFKFDRDFRSAVSDISYKWDFKSELKRYWSLDFGVQSSYYRHQPNRFEITNALVSYNEKPIHSLESVLYAENKVTIWNRLQLRMGARGVNYSTSDFSTYRIEPRTAIDLHFAKNHSFNLSYMVANQFSHLLFTQGEMMSNEVWVPASKTILPASSTQISGGWNGSFKDDLYQVEIAAYHKELTDVATYKKGYSSLMGDLNWRNKVESGGSGEAYGIEFYLKKSKGLWNGFIGYSWSRAFRKFEHLNKGKSYVFEYDRPHNLSLNVNRKLSGKLTFSGSWTFQSGLPFTPVIGRQMIPALIELEDEPYYYEAFIYGEKNSARMRYYHRLDLGLTRIIHKLFI